MKVDIIPETLYVKRLDSHSKFSQRNYVMFIFDHYRNQMILLDDTTKC